MSKDFTQELQALRARIDAIDSELIALLKSRMYIIHDVTALKRAHTPAQCHIRSGREGDMHSRIHDAFKGSDFPPAAALNIWRQIIGTSTHLESPITVSISRTTPMLEALAYEYFGRVITISPYATAQDALHAAVAGEATIALLAAPTGETLSAWQIIAESPLRIFASVPVLNADNAQPLAYALAALTPEPAADSLTLCVAPTAPAHAERILAQNDQCAVFTLAGNITEIASPAQIIGLIPRPLTDSTLQPRSAI